MSDITENQIQHFFINAMVADAFGVPVEFRVRDTYHVDGMTGHGTYDQPVGSWSDDSSLTLVLAENLTHHGSPTTMMQRFVAYLQEGEYTPSGTTFDVGAGTSRAIMAFIKDTPAEQSGDRSEYANGNGALMRLAPLAFVLVNEPSVDVRLHDEQAYTTTTHGHPRSVIASTIYVELLRALLRGHSLTDGLATAHRTMERCRFDRDEYNYFDRIWERDFAQTPVTMIRSIGYVVDTLEAAIWLNLNAESLDELIIKAANLGEDTDTIAQIATCLFSAAHPDATVPADWAKQLVHTDQMDTIIHDFAHHFATTVK